MNAATGAALAGGASVLQGLMQYQAKRQDHTNQLAYKRASDEYAQWSAGMQACLLYTSPSPRDRG